MTESAEKPKHSHGGARLNAGAKKTKPETVAIRIDKRLLNFVTEIKDKFKTTESLDDIIGKPTPKQDDAKLLKKIAKLEHQNELLRGDYLQHLKEISALKDEIKRLGQGEYCFGGIDDKQGLDETLRKRFLQFCHPDKHQDERVKKVACELIQELNKLKS